MSANCPCCSSRPFASCCEPLLRGEVAAPSPEALMRSRYAAYATRNFDYVIGTTDPQRRFDFDEKSSREWMDTSTFTGLEVLRASEDGNKGLVEFKAAYTGADGKPVVHHEISKFRKQAGVWYFREGKILG